MKRETWLMPFLSAAYWASCQTHCDQQTGMHSDMGDVRSAICGFCATLTIILFVRQVAPSLKQ